MGNLFGDEKLCKSSTQLTSSTLNVLASEFLEKHLRKSGLSLNTYKFIHLPEALHSRLRTCLSRERPGFESQASNIFFKFIYLINHIYNLINLFLKKGSLNIKCYFNNYNNYFTFKLQFNQ